MIAGSFSLRSPTCSAFDKYCPFGPRRDPHEQPHAYPVAFCIVIGSGVLAVLRLIGLVRVAIFRGAFKGALRPLCWSIFLFSCPGRRPQITSKFNTSRERCRLSVFGVLRRRRWSDFLHTRRARQLAEDSNVRRFTRPSPCIWLVTTNPGKIEQALEWQELIKLFCNACDTLRQYCDG
jgi:hypothetical protein